MDDLADAMVWPDWLPSIHLVFQVWRTEPSNYLLDVKKKEEPSSQSTLSALEIKTS